jgi:phasin
MAIASKKPAPTLIEPPAPAPMLVAPPAPAPVAMPAPSEPVKLFADPAATLGELQGTLRASVEKGLAQTRDAYAKAKATADESAAALETSYAAARAGVAAINAKAFDTLRANVEANFEFLKSSFAAATVADYVELQGEFTRQRIDAATDHAKEIGALAQKVAIDAIGPLKAQVAKTFSLSL